jgi:pesticin/yersiniabactin receptor
MSFRFTRTEFLSALGKITLSAALGALQMPDSALADQPSDESNRTGDRKNGPSPKVLPAVTISAGARNDSHRDANGSVVTIGRQALDDAEITNTLDLQRVLPGVQFAESGSFLLPEMSIRGISSSQNLYDPALTIYVDGVPQLPIFNSQTLLDVERVELYKGPQGTTYGKSAEGGVLDITTLPPDSDLRFHARAGLSSRWGNVEQTEIAGPIIGDLLYGSVSLMHVDTPGDLYNPITGAKHQTGSRSYAGNAKLRLAPAAQPWEANLAVSRDCEKASQGLYVPFDNLGSRTVALDPRMPSAYATPYLRRCGNSYSLTGRYDFGQWRVSALSAWQTVTTGINFPFMLSFVQQPEQWRQNVQELKLATTHAPGRSWDGVFGLFRQDTHQSRLAQFDLVVPSFANLTSSTSSGENESLAAYGDITWHATHALDLSAGLRVSRDQAWTTVNGSSATAVPGAYASFSGSDATAGNRVLGKVSTGYRLTPVWRIYGNISQGYRAGGFNLAPSSAADAKPFGAERAVSYEVGSRYEGTALSGSVALYRIDIHNTQLYSGNDLGYLTLSNIGDTRSIGAEFAIEWALGHGWGAGIDAFVNRSTFRRYNDPRGCPTCGGNRVPFAPNYGLTASLVGKLRTAAGKIRPRVSLRLLGSQYFDTHNSLRQGAYALLDTSIGWRPRRDLELTLYAQNLTNRAYRTYGAHGSAGDIAQAGLGRTLGATISLDY